jgi:broad specificity phosphatase PhoE
MDPALTTLGIKQALNLRQTFAPMNNITHILCSPMNRAINTALLAFPPLFLKGLKSLPIRIFEKSAMAQQRPAQA